MEKIEEAIIYATIMHQGRTRKLGEKPFILHPLEVAQILSTMTDDEDIITAGILHDIVEDTDGTLNEIEKRFGKRVADLVNSESENKYPEESRGTSWKRRKEESLLVLKNSSDIGVKMLWLADKLSNIRSLAGAYSEKGEEIWESLNQSDPEQHRWYYQSIGEIVELSLNKTGAFKEFIKHVNFIWPGTFDYRKARYRKYKEVSIDGCKMIGWGSKSKVYRYNDELVIKVFNQNNTYRDVEREIAHSRKAFVLGVPTAISFGIVSVGNRYGAMYELLDSETISTLIAKNPALAEKYAKKMAYICREIHNIKVSKEDGFTSVKSRINNYLFGGVEIEDEALAKKCKELIDNVPNTNNLVHGDFHTGNVFLHNGELLLIDLDRLSTGHPIFEISDIYYFYVILGENDPSVIENFMGFSYEISKQFFDCFLRSYLDTDDEDRLKKVIEKAAFLCYIRMVHKIHMQERLTDKDKELIGSYLDRIRELLQKFDALEF
ncbi:HD domain-containing protein [Butyrivibrio sp. AE3004]|uniref:HD domain-containing protein n=1 Tax=Butyrivibrio sp. AE3004 TaxID=1506994 RepID=UPI00068F4C46|nr:HD domain-containing protein [Butyrivibrio sp. AE3004]